MRLLIPTLFLFISSYSFAQTVCSPENKARLEIVLSELSREDRKDMATQDLVVDIGLKFLMTPYVEKALELPGEEKLVIDLLGLDCTTYAETVITLVRLTKMGKLTFEEYEKQLELLRYRDGKNTGYPSRLHYFSDWLYDNGRKRILQDVTQKVGGKPYPNSPSFMSENPQFYRQLANEEYTQELKKTEEAIGKRSYFFIPKEEIADLEANIQSGDLIAITATREDLDMVHVGFAIRKGGRIHLLHASSASKKVEISNVPLADYLMKSKSQSGIMVARLVDVK